MIPALKRSKSSLPAMNSSVEYASFHEVSSDEDSESAIKPTQYEHRRAVSFDGSASTSQSSTEPSVGLSTCEELWLPSVQQQQSTAPYNAGVGPIHIIDDAITPVNHADFDPINVVEELRQEHDFTVVPPSPPMQACAASVDIEAFYEFYPKVVPLVEPGASITEWEFEEAIYGIDFSRVFD